MPDVAPTCPRCTFPLQLFRRGHIYVDHCIRCAGNWVESQSDAPPEEVLADPEKWQSSAITVFAGNSHLPCPQGHGAMKEYRLTWAGDRVEVDFCQTCRGLWLDAEEGIHLQRILQRADAEGLSDRDRQEGQKPGVSSYLFQLFTGMPIEVWNPVRKTPHLVWGLAIVLTGIFGWELAIQFGTGAEALKAFWMTWGLVPRQVLGGHQLLTVGTHAFLHGGVFHLLGNLYFLWVFGDNIEDTLGKRQFTLLYGAAALAGAGLHVVMHAESTTPMVGASGAIAGLMGAYLMLFPKVKVWVVIFFIRFRLGVIWYLGFWILMQVALVQSGQTQVAAFAHIGGFAAGALLALPFRKSVKQLSGAVSPVN